MERRNRLSRRQFVVGAGSAGLGLLAGCGRVPWQGQAASKVPRVGVLGERSPADPFHETFRQGLHELGYIEGQNIALEYRYAHAVTDHIPERTLELLDLNIDVLVVGGGIAAQAAKARTSTVPIVFTQAGDPVGSGLVASLAHPGGNVTGQSVYAPELTPKRLELLKETVPGLSRVAVLWNAGNPGNYGQFREAEAAGRALNTAIESLAVRIPDDLEEATARAARAGAGAVLTLSDSATISHRSQIAAAALRNRLPTMFANKAYLAGGGLMSYGPDITDSFRHAAAHVDKILKAAKPADLPVEQPTRFELAINLKAAKALDLTLAPTLLARADEVIE